MKSLAGVPMGGSDALFIPAWLILAVALPLYAVQLLMGTDPLFASLVLLLVCLTGVTVNITGGLRTVPGMLIGLCAVKIVIASQLLKIWYGQPAHTHLEAPTASILIMVVGMLGMLTAVVVLRVLPLPRAGVLRPVVSPHMLFKLGMISLAAAVVSFTINRLAGDDVGGIFGLSRILFQPAMNLAIVAVTARAILISDRRRSVDLVVACVLGIQTVIGLLSFSKLVLMEPFLAYFITCFAFRYRFKWIQILVALALVAFAAQVLSPVINYARQPGISIAKRIDLIGETVGKLLRGEQLMKDHDHWAREFTYDVMLTPYYGEPKSLLDRYTLAHVDFVAHGVESYGTLGWATLNHGFEMLLPRFLHPDKPHVPSQPIIRYHIDRRAAIAPTQFAFPLFADGYVSFHYLGTYLFSVIFVGILLLVIRILGERLTDNIWAVLLLVMNHHGFAEANANIYMIMSTHAMIVLLAFIYGVKWVARYRFDLFSTVRRPRAPAPPPERLPSAARWQSAAGD